AYQQYPLPPEPKTDEPTSPRQVKIKSGGPKPGADVKGSGEARGAMAEPEGRSWIPFLLLGALVLFVVAAVLFASSGSGAAPPRAPPARTTAALDGLEPSHATTPPQASDDDTRTG